MDYVDELWAFLSSRIKKLNGRTPEVTRSSSKWWAERGMVRRKVNCEKRGKCLGERQMVGREVNGLMQIFLNRNRSICDIERVVV